MAKVTILLNGQPTTVEETTPGLFGKLGYQYVSGGPSVQTPQQDLTTANPQQPRQTEERRQQAFPSPTSVQQPQQTRRTATNFVRFQDPTGKTQLGVQENNQFRPATSQELDEINQGKLDIGTPRVLRSNTTDPFTEFNTGQQTGAIINRGAPVPIETQQGNQATVSAPPISPAQPSGDFVQVGGAFFQRSPQGLQPVSDPNTLRGLQDGSIQATEESILQPGAQRFASTIAPQTTFPNLPGLPTVQEPLIPEVVEDPTGTGALLPADSFFSNPQGSLKDFVKEIMETLNITNVNSQIEDITGQIEELENERDDEIASINDNPFISEADRSRKITAVQERFSDKINNRVNRLRLLEGTRDDAREQARFAAQTAISAFQADRQFGLQQAQLLQDRIEFLTEQAQQELDAQRGVFDIRSIEGGGLIQLQKDATGRIIGQEIIRQPSRAVSDFTLQQRFANEQKLIDKFNADQRVKDFREITQRFDILNRALEESQTTGNFIAVDQAIISSFNKITDPTSVVRESEYARSSQDLSLINRLRGQVQKVQTGGAGLTQEDRDAVVRLSRQFQQVAQQKAQVAMLEVRTQADAFGLNPVFGRDLQQQINEIDPAGAIAPFSQQELNYTPLPSSNISNDPIGIR